MNLMNFAVASPNNKDSLYGDLLLWGFFFFLDVLLEISPKNIWAYWGDIFGVMSERQRRAAADMQWVEARGAAGYLTV